MQVGEIKKESFSRTPEPNSRRHFLYSSMMLPRSDTYRPSKNYREKGISTCVVVVEVEHFNASFPGTEGKG